MLNKSDIKSLILLIIIGAVGFGIYYLLNNDVMDFSFGSDHEIEVTPEKITEIKNIGQWEFLSVVDEQVIDTVRHNKILADDRLACIYYGNVRLGVDLKKAPKDWVNNSNDTITVTLPQPGILDMKFIDEARTKVFYERGRWSASAREQMYRRARKLMAADALTPENIQSVKQQAEKRFDSLFRSLGAKEVTIVWEDNNEPKFNRY